MPMQTNNRGAHALLFAATIAICAGSILTAQPVRADETIVVQQSAVTGQGSPVPQTIKLLYKGNNTRVEFDGGPIVQYEGKDGIIYTLDTSQKTFYTTLFSQVQQSDSVLPQALGNQVTQSVKLNLNKTDQTASIAGVTAQKYLLTGTITFTRNQPAEQRGGGGHHRGGGGFPGGGMGLSPEGPSNGQAAVSNTDYSSNGSAPVGLPQISIGGEVWLSDALKLPGKASTLPAIQLAAASGGPFWQALTVLLDKRHEIPLLARITVSRTQPGSGGPTPDQYGAVLETGQGTPPVTTTTVTTFTVQSFSSDTLDDTLFQAPLDYKLIAAPENPFVPGAPAIATQPGN